jgi:RNA polymerase sigma-70 factor (ECF subfamily)
MASERRPLPTLAGGQVAESEGTSDEALAVRGDADSFVHLYRNHVRSVYGYLHARLGSPQDAEDLTALVFERAWASLKGYRPTGSFRGWLFTIAHRALADHYRHRQPRPIPMDQVAETLLDPATGPEEAALLAAQVQQALRVAAGLSREQQEVLGLRFLAELRYSEIAQVTGKGESAVKMIAYRALEEMRRRYHDADE